MFLLFFFFHFYMFCDGITVYLVLRLESIFLVVLFQFFSFWIACCIFNFVFLATLTVLVLCAFSNIFLRFGFQMYLADITFEDRITRVDGDVSQRAWTFPQMMTFCWNKAWHHLIPTAHRSKHERRGYLMPIGVLHFT